MESPRGDDPDSYPFGGARAAARSAAPAAAGSAPTTGGGAMRRDAYGATDRAGRSPTNPKRNIGFRRIRLEHWAEAMG